jgi:HTH-type transcriptional regulator / antitoxin HigA
MMVNEIVYPLADNVLGDCLANVSTAFNPDWVSPPGDTIIDLLEERGWNQEEFANRTGYTTKEISLLINGNTAITDDTALQLERVLGSPASFWLTREAHYRKRLAETKSVSPWRSLLIDSKMFHPGCD